MSTTNGCPTELELIEYCDGRLESGRVDQVRLHIATCEPCGKAEDWIKTHLLRPIDEDEDGDEDQGDALKSDGMDSTKFLANQGRTFGESNIDHSLFSPSGNGHAMGRLGKYDILRMLGQGGMGVVLQGHNEQLRRDVAIKMLNRSLSANPIARRRFIREARAAAAINHSNVVIIHDVDEHRGVPFIVMEMVSGRTLRDEIRRETTLDPIRVIRLSAQIAMGLASAHAQGVIHRDIKPGNIMLEDEVDRVKIADFGLARAAIDNIELTSRELAVGTPAYMSPEQVAGHHVDARSDLFALGCVMHAMLTAHSPFHGRTALEMARMVETHEPPNLHEANPAVPKFLADIIEKLLQKDPDQRFQSAAELANVLNQHLVVLNQTPTDQMAHLLRTATVAAPTPTEVSPAPEKTSPTKKSSRTVWYGAGIILVAALMAIAFLTPARTWIVGGNDTDENHQPPPVFMPLVPNPGDPSDPKGPVVPEVVNLEFTVSKSGPADFRTLGEALAKATKGATIRVLDDRLYDESVVIGGERHEDLTLISQLRATLATPESVTEERHTLDIMDARNVTVRGLAITTPGKGHAVFVRGTVDGVVLEDLHCENTATSGPYATVQIYISSAGPRAAPLRLENCEVSSGGDAPCVWIHEPAHDVVLTKNSFTAKETSVAVWNTCQRLEISHNLFLEGTDGISLPNQTWSASCHIQISNNTFLCPDRWFVFGGESVDGGSVEIMNNLILGSELFGMNDVLQTNAIRVWSFGGNHWERGTFTPADVGRQGEIATLHEAMSLEIQRDKSADDYLVPLPGSSLLEAGRGNGLPKFVGAKDRID